MIIWFKHLWKQIFGRKTYLTKYLQDLPDSLQPKVLYVLGEGKHLWSATMLCPCGCNATLQMSLQPEGRPRWVLTKESDGTVSLSPSVWRQIGCKSHFFFRKGVINWCKDIR